MASSSFNWTGGTLTVKMKGASKRANEYLKRTTAYYSLRAETYAKSKARWRDRTGNARSGLSSSYSARIGAESSRFEIDIYHRVNYGIWLEVRFNRKYAIINKTVQAEGENFFRKASELMAQMFGGS